MCANEVNDVSLVEVAENVTTEATGQGLAHARIQSRAKSVLRLDVGCGSAPKGTVNVDLNIKATVHRPRDTVSGCRVLNVREIPNFVRADGLHLPFRDGAFREVVSSHLIEHVADPVGLIRELVRVARDRVVLYCPHRFGDNKRKSPQHKNFFGKTWFICVLRRMRLAFTVEYSEFRFFPYECFALFRFPKELKVAIYK